MNNTTTYRYQSVFDLAIQEYGSIEGVFELMAANPSLELDSDIESGSIVKLEGDVSSYPVVEQYNKYSIAPATGNIDGLLAYCENDGGMITKTYNYPLTSGDKTFDGIRLYNLNKDCTIQINYSDIDADDVRVEIETSLDGVNFSSLLEATWLLDKTRPSHTFKILGLVTSYVRVKLTVGSATTGTIDKVLIMV